MKKHKERAGLQEQKPAQGIHIDTKTIVSITVVLLAVMLFAGVMTQIVPQGKYNVSADGSIINGTYRVLDGARMPFWKVLLAPLLVFTTSEAATGLLIIVMIVLIGGTFLILDKSGVLKYIMSAIIQKFEKRKYTLLAVMVFVCMLLSSTMGILEESVTLVPLAVAISLALGWDSLVGLGLSLVSIAFGFTAATFNPFNVVTVQKLAGLQPFSGLGFRILVFVCVYLVLVGFLTAYAKKIEKHPEKSLVYESDKALHEKYSTSLDRTVLKDRRLRKATLTFTGCLASVFLFVLLGFLVESLNFISLPAMAILFTVGGLCAGHIAGIRGKNLFKSFLEGVKSIAPCIPLIIFVISITYILKEGQIIDTLLYQVYRLIEHLGSYGAILILFLFIVALEFFVGSGTAKAFLVMPLVVPLSDMVGLTRQSMVLSFCLGDGFTNLLYPTSGIMLIAIGMVGVSYGKWLRWTWKLFALEGVLSVGLMLLAVAVGYH